MTNITQTDVFQFVLKCMWVLILICVIATCVKYILYYISCDVQRDMVLHVVSPDSRVLPRLPTFSP